MFTQHAKRPSIGTAAAVGSGGGGSGRRQSSSLPPSPWSPTTRYSPFAEADEEAVGARGDVGGSGGSSSSTVTQLEQQHDSNGSEKQNQGGPDGQERSRPPPLLGTWVRRVSKLGIPGVRGWKGYVRVGDEQRGEVEEEEDDVGYGGDAGSMSARRQTKRPWWRSVAAALTAANVLLFVVSLLVWGHANGVARRGARYGGEDARAPTGFDRELRFDTPTTFQAYHAYANGTPNAASNALWTALRPPGDGLVAVRNSAAAQLPWAQPSKHAPATHRAYGLSVFHQLHCLDYLRQAFYPRAMATEFAHDDQDPVMHRDHCVDYLRQAIMCSADVTFEPLLVPQGHIDGMGATHLCRNWDRVFSWAFEHRLVW